jgi:restriction endonuclease S subunit
MEEMLEQVVSELQLDKSKWNLIKFGDVAIHQKKSVDRDNTDLTRYVKGEHMGSEDLHLREWGELTDEYLGPAFIRKFEEGDILYGSRRTYLRKVVIAPFSGITSNTTFVIKANEKRIDKRLLPFIMMSEGFTENSIRNSKGSVNPYINWKDIANYEFLLPPKDQQAKLAELLWAIDEVIGREKEVLKKIEKVKYQICLNSFFNGKKVNRVFDISLPKSNWMLAPLREIVPDIEYGISISIPDNQDPNGIPIVSTAEIDREGNLDYSIIRKIKYQKMNTRVTLKSGDVIFNWRNTAELIGKTAIFNQPEGDKNDYTFASFLLRMRCDGIMMNNVFLMQLLNFYRINEIFLGLARKAVNQANFNKNEVGDLLIPVPPYNEQIEIVNDLNSIENLKTQVKIKITSSRLLQKCIINQIF